MPVCRRYIALLAVSSALWSSTAAAFFCFSANSEGRRQESDFSPPPPIGAFVYGDPPVPYYTIPAMPQRRISPVDLRNSDYRDLDPPVAPVELPDEDDPVPHATFPQQHIFH
jgi:hypothetical protein